MGKGHEMRAPRLAIVGIDGFSPVHMDRFLAQGRLPALGALVKRGVRIPLVSTLPATTPVAWATIATGAHPSTTGIEGFLVHRPGDPLDRRVSGCYSYRCRAQTLWEAATQAGRSAYVVKFPLSYPSTTATFRLDGAAGWGGLRCFHEAASSAVSDCVAGAQPPCVQSSAEPWLAEEARPDPLVWRGVWRLPTLWGGRDVVLHVGLAQPLHGEPRVELAETPDRRSVLASIAQGEWSAPLNIHAAGRKGDVDCCFRVKLLSCSASEPRLRLLNTPVHERTGHSAPDAIWQKYIDQAGPIEEQTEPSLVFKAGLDLETQLELFRLNGEWLQRISTALLTQEPWELFMVQVHFVDWAHHLLQGAIDPRHPDFDPATASRYEDALLRAYLMADELVAAVATAIGPEANLVVLGDHGQDVQHTTLRINEWLAAEGFLHWAAEDSQVDWSRTRAYAMGNYLYLNQLGREPEGILAGRELEATRAAVIDRLLGLEDPRTGTRPVLIAGDKREFERLGADGVGVGDIVFCLRTGYQVTNDRGAIFSQTRAMREFTSGHDHFWPLDPRIHTRLFAAGPSFRSGYAHSRAAHLVDVAPTLSAALGIAPPAHCEGHVIRELLRPSPQTAPGLEPMLAQREAESANTLSELP